MVSLEAHNGKVGRTAKKVAIIYRHASVEVITQVGIYETVTGLTCTHTGCVRVMACGLL